MNRRVEFLCAFALGVILPLLFTGCASAPTPAPVPASSDPVIYRPSKPINYPVPFFRDAR